MKHLALAAVLFFSLMNFACTSKDKEPDTHSAKSEESVREPRGGDVSKGDLLEQYGLIELNSVATALTEIIDRARDPKTSAKTSERSVDSLLDCPIKSEQASGYLMSLNGLIETQKQRERELYQEDPASYARSRELEVCGTKCACGVLASVLEEVSPSRFKAPSARSNHGRYLQRLQTKARIQSRHDRAACARQQSWFCSSDLKKFLDKDGGFLDSDF